jgi:hypothetical protein
LEVWRSDVSACGAFIDLMRRSIQSCAEISLFPLGESGSPSAINNASLSFAIRVKKLQE